MPDSAATGRLIPAPPHGGVVAIRAPLLAMLASGMLRPSVRLETDFLW
jgi:hypothetical protein